MNIEIFHSAGDLWDQRLKADVNTFCRSVKVLDVRTHTTSTRTLHDDYINRITVVVIYDETDELTQRYVNYRGDGQLYEHFRAVRDTGTPARERQAAYYAYVKRLAELCKEQPLVGSVTKTWIAQRAGISLAGMKQRDRYMTQALERERNPVNSILDASLIAHLTLK